MYTVYHLKANELDNSFLEALKTMFKNKKIEIVVSEAGENGVGEDETAYLLSSPANRDRLLKAIENIAQNKNLVSVELDAVQ